MGLFKKILLSVGVGGAQVDTVISQSSVRIGEDIQGVVNIMGGSAEQNISSVEVELKTEYIREVEDRKERCTVTLGKLVVDRNIVVAPSEKKQIPFTFRTPDYTPISMGRRNVWVETELEIPLALDPEDRDYLDIRPSRTMEVVLDAIMNVLEFRLREVECKKGHIRGRDCEFIQEFEFVPQRAFRGALDELEIIFLSNPEGIDILVEIDRSVRDFKSLMQEAIGLDESKIIFTITHHEASRGSDYVAQILEDKINEYC